MRRHAAVTIIEVLVAITVVAMIASITYPTLAQRLCSARRFRRSSRSSSICSLRATRNSRY